jgi:haloalkane dehalogenase
MKTVRTPDERFADLPDYSFAPHYADVDDLDDVDEGGGPLRVHFLDEGPADGPVALLMHGEPSWAFLYRHMIPVLVDAGIRCIVPDLVGFGRSDKPTEQSDYTYARHVEWMRQLLFGHLDLRDITYFGQDWGGLIGLRLVAAEPERYRGVVVSNTGMPTGEKAPTEAFLAWQSYAATADDLPVGAIISGGCTTKLTPEVIAAYDAPFPDDTFKAGARRFPALVPTSTDDPASADNIAAWKSLEASTVPFVLAFSDRDPITKGGHRAFEHLPGAQGQPQVTIEGGGHFVQEDRGPECAAVVIDLIERTK